MRNLEQYLKNREVDNKKLLEYGFSLDKDIYTFKKKINNDEFEVNVQISDSKKASKLVDLSLMEEYYLVDVEDATGEFVGHLRKEYENVLKDIINKCTLENVFKEKQTKEVIKYVREKYNDELEFLWENDDSAIWRNKLSGKWYGVLMTIPKSKLSINSEEIVEVIDIHYQKGETKNIIDGKSIFLGYHMNKESWITIVLDGSLEIKRVKELIDNSYSLSAKNKSGSTMDELSKKVYDYLLKVPKDKVVTYKQIAEYLGNKGLARIVGTILHNNPDGDKYPCYKVLNSKGELAEAFVFGGKDEQKKRLEKDGIKVTNNIVDLKKYKWEK